MKALAKEITDLEAKLEAALFKKEQNRNKRIGGGAFHWGPDRRIKALE